MSIKKVKERRAHNAEKNTIRCEDILFAALKSNDEENLGITGLKFRQNGDRLQYIGAIGAIIQLVASESNCTVETVFSVIKGVMAIQPMNGVTEMDVHGNMNTLTKN